jgi:hypothetical protein
MNELSAQKCFFAYIASVNILLVIIVTNKNLYTTFLKSLIFFTVFVLKLSEVCCTT